MHIARMKIACISLFFHYLSFVQMRTSPNTISVNTFQDNSDKYFYCCFNDYNPQRRCDIETIYRPSFVGGILIIDFPLTQRRKVYIISEMWMMMIEITGETLKTSNLFYAIK